MFVHPSPKINGSRKWPKVTKMHSIWKLDRPSTRFYSIGHNKWLCSLTLSYIGMKMVIFYFRESFLRFYRLLRLNENDYQKTKNENGKIIWKWKRKWFEHPPIVFENYHIFEVFYRILPIEIPYSRTMPAPLLSIFLECRIYTFRESWVMTHLS